ncbi:unnamed protein product, partial [Porites lobata]
MSKKKHESATSEGLYCTHVTGYQAAHSLLRTVTPLAPEIVFQLSNIKVCWTDKCTVLFRPPFPDQTEGNKTLLQWLRYHQTSGAKPKPYTDDRVLVGVKYVSLFNPIFFYQHLTMNFPHREAKQLRHAEEDTMPETIKHFAQSIAFTPQNWDTAETITAEFEHEVAAPVALLAQGYNSIFYEDVTTDTLHGAFSIPIDGPLLNEINHRSNQYDLIVADEASMISPPIFGVMAFTLNRMNLRPVVVLAGDKCQQQPLQTVNGRITSTTSIINNNATFSSSNAVIHRLHQQFR